MLAQKRTMNKPGPPDERVCACHGVAVDRLHAYDRDGAYRQRHYCRVDHESLGYDGGVRRDDYERNQRRAR